MNLLNNFTAFLSINSYLELSLNLNIQHKLQSMHEELRRTRSQRTYLGRFSKVIVMDQTTYSTKESGKSSITEGKWNRLAKQNEKMI
jgi:hypothetical protein